MGLTPGCGGAIIMMPMYTRGYVTYGTVIATLIATLGDAAFVLIGAVFLNPDFLTPVLIVHVTSFVVGVTWGYGADAIGVTPSRPLGRFGPTFGSKELLGEEAASSWKEILVLMYRARIRCLKTFLEKCRRAWVTRLFTKVIVFGGQSPQSV